MIWSTYGDDRRKETKFKRTNSARLSTGPANVSPVADVVRHRAPGECAHQQNLPDRKHELSASASGTYMATYYFFFFSSGQRKSLVLWRNRTSGGDDCLINLHRKSGIEENEIVI